ncbi:MAG: gamma-glutamyltransferase [Gemmatimonadetes bacterium]|nr:gamma-glutamyltransferase [Gemmatimonadota bacterium]
MRGWPDRWPYPAGSGGVSAPTAMVATTDRYASDVGVAALRAGGSAVDAAIAVSFALAVVNPEAGNLGGGGLLLVRTAEGEVASLDFRSRAPLSATRDMFVGPGGVATDRSLHGHLAAAVPGSVQGMWEAHSRFGILPWAALVEPAVGLAMGFVIGKRFLRSLIAPIVDELRRFPSSATVFLPGGRVPGAGETLRQPELAATLAGIRDAGPDGFYRGATADRIVDEMRRGGGLIAHEDLASYEAVWRDPLTISYRGHTIITMPPPSSGGVVLAQTSHLLDPFSLSALDWQGAEHIHLMAEAWKRAFADRNQRLGDPDFVHLPTEELTSPEHGELRGRGISRERATPSGEIVALKGGGREGNHTTHFSIVGPDGDAVAVTTTLNTWYGSKLVVEGTGVLLNNDMDDFTIASGLPNYFGLIQGEANAIEPGKRMLSAMTPTIVLGDERPDGPLLIVLGSAGGPRIITTIFQVLSSVLDHGMDLATAISAPRFHHQHLPDEIAHEPNGLRAGVGERLRSMGHQVVAKEEAWGDVHAIGVNEHGVLRGVSDPRRGGVAVGF